MGSMELLRARIVERLLEYESDGRGLKQLFEKFRSSFEINCFMVSEMEFNIRGSNANNGTCFNQLARMARRC